VFKRGDTVANQIVAEGKHVVILGGGDTGADCLGTAHRQNALSTTMLAIGKQPPTERPMDAPWPVDPVLFEVQSAHEEGGRGNILPPRSVPVGNDAGEVRC
jgi:glutamate synthase (NADPH) small chain